MATQTSETAKGDRRGEGRRGKVKVLMPQPEFVPVKDADAVRPEDVLPPADEWRADRPAEITTIFAPNEQRFGHPGPDQGYGLKLARHVAAKAKLGPHEHKEDAVAGCLAVGLQRAALFGRAPMVYDFQLAFTLWGYLGDAPADLIEYRTPLFEAASHDYWDQRRIADAVPEATLRLSPADVAARISNWRNLINVG